MTMKRTLSLILALLMLVGLAACSSGADKGYNGSLTQLATDLYKNNTPEFMLGEPMEIDLNDNDAVLYYLGLSDGSRLKEAVFSEPMIGSIAYSMCLVRVKDAGDVETVKKDIFDNVNTSKWICVTADQLRVAASGDVVLLVMGTGDLVDDLVSAFTTACGGLTGETLSRG